MLFFFMIPGTNGFLCRSSAVNFERFELDGLCLHIPIIVVVYATPVCRFGNFVIPSGKNLNASETEYM